MCATYHQRSNEQPLPRIFDWIRCRARGRRGLWLSGILAGCTHGLCEFLLRNLRLLYRSERVQLVRGEYGAGLCNGCIGDGHADTWASESAETTGSAAGATLA